jgi:hypothetical protein
MDAVMIIKITKVDVPWRRQQVYRTGQKHKP